MKLNAFFALILPASSLFLDACSQPVKPVTSAQLPPTRVFQRNYEIGARKSAFVGQPVVSFKDYLVLKRQGLHYRPSFDFRATQALDTWHYLKTTEDYVVRGELAIDGVPYKVLRIAAGFGYDLAVLVGPDGKLYHRMLNNEVLLVGSAKFEPPGVVFSPSASEAVVDTAAGFQNFELLYGGTDGRSFTLTYREYTPQDLMKPAFSQVLTYENSSPSVRFRNTKLEIHSVSSESLTFTVVSDEATSGR